MKKIIKNFINKLYEIRFYYRTYFKMELYKLEDEENNKLNK